MIEYFITPLIVSVIFFALMWSGKLQGYGNYEILKSFSAELHDAIRYSAAGVISVNKES